MAMTPEDYQNAGLSLLPVGMAWDKSSGSTLANLMLAGGDELARIDATGDALLGEAIPSGAFMLLSDWEEFAGLPDCPVSIDSTVENRRLALATKLRMTGSLCTKFFENLAEQRGYKIAIKEFYPHHCMRDCMYPLHPQENWWTAFVYMGAPFLHNMTVLDNVLTRLKVYDYGDLECLLERYKPAHITFVYIMENE